MKLCGVLTELCGPGRCASSSNSESLSFAAICSSLRRAAVVRGHEWTGAWHVDTLDTSSAGHG